MKTLTKETETVGSFSYTQYESLDEAYKALKTAPDGLDFINAAIYQAAYSAALQKSRGGNTLEKEAESYARHLGIAKEKAMAALQSVKRELKVEKEKAKAAKAKS